MTTSQKNGRPEPLFVSVVLPAADEAGNIPKLLAGLREQLTRLCDEHEIVVVVPKPSDPGAAVAAAGGARVLVQKRPGYGGALKEGLLAARGDYIVTMDADLSHPPEFVAELIAHRDDAEVVVCSRYVDGGSAATMSGSRHLLSRILNQVFSRVLAVPVHDMSSGYRIYQRKVLAELELHGEKYDILEEILVKVYSLGWTVSEIPFRYAEREHGASHASVVGFAPHFLRTLARLFRVRNDFRSADYDARAYDSVFLPQRLWQRRRFEIVAQMAGDRAPRLDVGCGSSRIVQDAPLSVAVDVAMPKLRFLRRSNRRLVRASTLRLPFRDASFDAAIHSQLVGHIPYDRAIFLELNRVLKPDAVLVMGTPDYGRLAWRATAWLYDRLMPNVFREEHVEHYTRDRLIEELATAGFAIEKYRYVFGGELIVKCVKREDVAEPRVDEQPG